MLVKELTIKCELESKVWFDIGKLIFKLSDGSNQGYRLWEMYSELEPFFYFKDDDELNELKNTCKEYWDFLKRTE